MINVKNLLVGATGTTAIEVTKNMSGASETIDFIQSLPQINEGVGIISQIVILVVTLVGLFKRNKNKEKQPKI